MERKFGIGMLRKKLFCNKFLIEYKVEDFVSGYFWNVKKVVCN